jgi:hypothetical protein
MAKDRINHKKQERFGELMAGEEGSRLTSAAQEHERLAHRTMDAGR